MTALDAPRETKANDELTRILDRVEKSLSEDLIPVEIFNSQTVFDAEVERIFTKCWVFVAHETEIPKTGDYVVRKIGLDPVIVSRDADGQVHVMSNYCRHRGTQVCQSDSGNTRFFRCPYHGWTYKNNGDWAGAPHLAEAYGERLDAREWGLLRAPKVATRHGFIFATLDPDAPSLEDYLGDGAWMFDLVVGLHPDGMKVIGPPDRYRVKGDWKTAAENFAGDVYHIDSLHWGTEEVGISQGLQGTCFIGRSYEMGNGHNFAGHAWTTAIHPGFTHWGYPDHIKSQFDDSALDEAQKFVVHHEPPTVGNFFPNLSFIRFAVPRSAGGVPQVVTSFRQWQPVGPGEIELWSWQLAWSFQDDADAMNDQITGQFVFGSGGIFEQDDTVAWEGIPKAAASPWHRKEGAVFHYAQGHNSPIDQTPDAEWQGPGIRRSTGYGEHRQLAFFRHWLQVMRGDAAPADRNDAAGNESQEG